MRAKFCYKKDKLLLHHPCKYLIKNKNCNISKVITLPWGRDGCELKGCSNKPVPPNDFLFMKVRFLDDGRRSFICGKRVYLFRVGVQPPIQASSHLNLSNLRLILVFPHVIIINPLILILILSFLFRNNNNIPSYTHNYEKRTQRGSWIKSK